MFLFQSIIQSSVTLSSGLDSPSLSDLRLPAWFVSGEEIAHLTVRKLNTMIAEKNESVRMTDSK